MRGKDRVPACALPDALRAIRDGLRAGLSLRQALLRAAATERSPFARIGSAVSSGRPLTVVLEEAAVAEPRADLRSALLVLGVQARSGGDPAPAVGALEASVRRRTAAARELRALTTQGRLGARAIVLLTPAFLLLLAVLDPGGTWASFGLSGTRVAVVTGLVLQGLGALWIGRIVSPRAGERRACGVPVLRAATVLLDRGRERSRRAAVRAEVARTAELLALLLGAGAAPSRAVELVSKTTAGPLGDALREAVAATRVGAPRVEALRAAVAGSGVPEGERLMEALASGHSLGVPVAEALRSLAAEIGEANAAEASEDARKASIKVLVPLGLLVLPAFILACLVPLFLGGLRGLAL